MKKILALALTLSALTIASMTLFASDTSTSQTTDPKTSTATAYCEEGLSLEDCTQTNQSCKTMAKNQGSNGCCP